MVSARVSPDTTPQADEQPQGAGVRCSLTVPELARRWRVGEAKIRALIRSGELRAFNTSGSLCRRKRWVIMPEAVEQYEQRWSSAPPSPQPAKRQTGKDYYPD